MTVETSNLSSGESDKVPSGDGQGEGTKAKDKVDYESYQRAIAQLKTTKAKLQEHEERENALLMQQKVKEEEDLLKKQDYQKLLDRKNAEVELERKTRLELESKLSEAEKNRIDSHKLSSFYEKLPGKIKKKEYLSFVDLDSIEVDENGKVNEETVMRTVNDFMKEHHFLVEAKNKTMPNEAPSNYSGKLNYDQWLKLPLKEKKKYSPKDIYH